MFYVYNTWFIFNKKSNYNIKVLMNSNSKTNIMTLIYTLKKGLKI